jgi:hypothetical protein
MLSNLVGRPILSKSFKNKITTTEDIRGNIIFILRPIIKIVETTQFADVWDFFLKLT